VFKSRKGLDGIVKGKFTLGADAAVAAGPVGHQAEAATDIQLKEEIYAYS
jgi:lipid-binding SYLF domain-containing protein